MEEKIIRKNFKAEGLSVEIFLDGKIEEEVIQLFRILTKSINKFMREEVMRRRGKELFKLKKEDKDE